MAHRHWPDVGQLAYRQRIGKAHVGGGNRAGVFNGDAERHSVTRVDYAVAVGIHTNRCALLHIQRRQRGGRRVRIHGSKHGGLIAVGYVSVVISADRLGLIAGGRALIGEIFARGTKRIDRHIKSEVKRCARAKTRAAERDDACTLRSRTACNRRRCERARHVSKTGWNLIDKAHVAERGCARITQHNAVAHGVACGVARAAVGIDLSGHRFCGD